MRILTAALALALALGVTLAACGSKEEPAACTIDDGPPLDASGRADGIYGVLDGKLAPAPIAPFEAMSLTGTGADAESGKRWVGVHLRDAEAKALRDFMSGPKPRGIAVVVAGKVASAHKVREALTGSDAQVSCCDPKACDRWLEILGRAGSTR